MSLTQNEAQGLRLQELREFKACYGHCRVPVIFPENQHLANWAVHVRGQYRQLANHRQPPSSSTITLNLIEQLKELDFDWGAVKSDKERAWQRNFPRLQDFQATHGHCRVTKTYSDWIFRRWVKTIKTEYKNRQKLETYKVGNLTEERINCLFHLGLEWDLEHKSAGKTFETRIQELKIFQSEHGHCRVPSLYPENQYLANWVGKTRQLYLRRKQLNMPTKHVAELDKMNCGWEDTNDIDKRGLNYLKTSWPARMHELQKFHALYGHCRLKSFDPVNQYLSDWAGRIRGEFKKFWSGQLSFLTAEKIHKLNQLGFDWGGNHSAFADKTWSQQIQAFKDHREKYGDAPVPKDTRQNRMLVSWIDSVRFQYKLQQQQQEDPEETLLSKERILELESLEFEWEPKKPIPRSEKNWQAKLLELKEFHKANGHCRVPPTLPENQSLANWAKKQQTELRKHQQGLKSSMIEGRITELDTLGFEWDVTPSTRISWESRVEKLKEFQLVHHHCRVPQKYPENQSLSYWVAKMRKDYKKYQDGEKSYLTAEKIAELTSLGFDWDARSKRARTTIQPTQIQEQNDESTQDQEESNDVSTNQQIQDQEKDGNAHQDQEAAVREQSDQSESMYQTQERNDDSIQDQEEVQDQANDGNTQEQEATVREESDRSQSIQIQEQNDDSTRDQEEIQDQENDGNAHQDQEATVREESDRSQSIQDQQKEVDLARRRKRRRSEAIAGWEIRIGELKEFQKTHGHSRVPEKFEENRPLAYWAQNVRSRYKKQKQGTEIMAGRLTDEQITELENLGFDWQIEQASVEVGWDAQLKALREYKEIHGDCYVPAKFHDNLSLGYWVQTTRRDYRKRKRGEKNRLNEERIEQLNSLGFDFEVRNRRRDYSGLWDTRIQQLQEFHEINGHCEVPSKKPEHKKLWVWANSLRLEYAKREKGESTTRLTDKRIEELNALGFQWIGPSKRQKISHAATTNRQESTNGGAADDSNAPQPEVTEPHSPNGS